MIVDKTKWHYKWYCWFKEDSFPTNTNLCPYARTVFLYTPLKFLFAKGKIKKVPIPVILYPILAFEIPRWLGMISYEAKIVVLSIYVIAAIVTAIFGTSVATSKLIVYLGNKKLRSKMTDAEWFRYEQFDKDKNFLPAHLQKEPFKNKLIRLSNSIQSSLIWNYIKALHDKVCPIIKFE